MNWEDCDNLNIGKVLKEISSNKNFVIVDNNLNYNDHYYSTIKIIKEEIYLKLKGKTVDGNIILKNSLTVDYEDFDLYKFVNRKYDVNINYIYVLGDKI